MPYLLTLKLPVMVQTYLAFVGNASWAPMAELASQGKNEVVQLRLVEITKLIAVLGTAVLVPILFFNYAFVSLWVGEEQFAGPIITLVGSANALLIALVGFWTWCILGVGEIHRTKPVYTIATIVNVISSIALCYRYGVIGPILGTLSAYVFVLSWSIPRILRDIFAVSLRSLFLSFARPGALAVNYSLALYFLGVHRLKLGWLELAGAVAASTLLYLVLAWALVLTNTERQQWNGRIHSLINRS